MVQRFVEERLYVLDKNKNTTDLLERLYGARICRGRTLFWTRIRIRQTCWNDFMVQRFVEERLYVMDKNKNKTDRLVVPNS
jgi:hypothetical protein